MIPRATSVLARRLPPSKPGRGNAQNYMPQLEGAMSTSNGRQGNSYQPGGTGGSGGGGGQGWKPGAVMSKRFDGREDSRTGAAQVRLFEVSSRRNHSLFEAISVLLILAFFPSLLNLLRSFSGTIRNPFRSSSLPTHKETKLVLSRPCSPLRVSNGSKPRNKWPRKFIHFLS